MLIRVADTYDNEVETSIEGLTSLIDPLIMVLMGAFIFCIMLAILLPIFEMNSAVR
jgi:type II secretory pathway component PulF